MSMRKSWLFCLALLILSGLLYSPFLNNPIVFDDVSFFKPSESSGQIVVVPEFAQASFLSSRWLPYATIAWTVNNFGFSMIALRIESLLLHALVGVVLFFLIRNLYQEVLGERLLAATRLSISWAAFYCALLFLMSPVAVYGAAYLVERSIVMSTLFGLLALLAYLRGLATEQNKWLWISVVAYWCAMMIKPHVIMLPLVALAMTVLVQGCSVAIFKRLIGIYLGFIVCATYVTLQSIGILGQQYEPNASSMLEVIHVDHALFFSVVTQCSLFFKYLGLWIVPNPNWMSVDMREPFAQEVSVFYLLGVLSFLLYGAVAIKLLMKRGAYGLFGFSLLFPWVMFFTELSVVRIQESFVLYRSYLWMPGMLIALPLIFLKWEAKFAASILFLLAMISASLAVDRLVTFTHGYLLWDDAAKLVDGKKSVVGADRIYANRGLILKNMLRYPEAAADLKQAIALRPEFGYYHHNLAVIYLESGAYLESIVEFKESIRIAPENMRGYYGIALAYIHLKRLDLAKANFETSCKQGLKLACEKVSKFDEDNPRTR